VFILVAGNTSNEDVEGILHPDELVRVGHGTAAVDDEGQVHGRELLEILLPPLNTDLDDFILTVHGELTVS
jgi:hypothetical protein